MKNATLHQEEGVRTLFISSFPDFPQMHHVISDLACVADREVTRAAEAEGEERD